MSKYPMFKEGNVVARCPGCDGHPTTYEYRDSSKQFGTLEVSGTHRYQNVEYKKILYLLLRCSSCHKGGLAKIHAGDHLSQGRLEAFYPVSLDMAKIPSEVPQDILTEFREAEACISNQLFRAASAMLRSTLEKLLKANGYKNGNLKDKINAAADDRVIAEAKRQKVHDDVRVLGNDVLHDEWREVTQEEVEAAHHYVQRLLEEFYDDRVTIEKLLKERDEKKKSNLKVL